MHCCSQNIFESYRGGGIRGGGGGMRGGMGGGMGGGFGHGRYPGPRGPGYPNQMGGYAYPGSYLGAVQVPYQVPYPVPYPVPYTVPYTNGYRVNPTIIPSYPEEFRY